MAHRDYRDIPRWANVTQAQWDDWRWQVSHRIKDLQGLKEVFPYLLDEEERAIRDSEHLFRLGITPYYATLMDPADPQDPIRLQAIPKYHELHWADFEMADPLREDTDSPVPWVTHRYPDRVLFLITHECSFYCRHCTRRRIVGDMDAPSNQMMDSALDYIRRTPAIRDVLISGGDPLTVPDRRLEYVISHLRQIEHVEIIRIGSRMPVVLPQRITDDLVHMLRKYHPIWFNTHFNHPNEITPEAREACRKLADAGIPLGNQSVLLKGINDCPVVMRKLVHELVKMRVRPYYLYACDLSEGLSHFRTSVAKGIEIIESLRGHTSGYAVPQFVIDAPGGGGKIPVNPNYLISQAAGKVLLRNFEGRIAVYHEGTDADHFRDGTCSLCQTDHSGISGVAGKAVAVQPPAGADGNKVARPGPAAALDFTAIEVTVGTDGSEQE